MPQASFTVSIFINAAPAEIFAYVSDLTRHGEWAANELQVRAVDDALLATGKRYRSHAIVRGNEFDAELQVKAYQPPTRFVFSGQDNTGKFQHTFTFTPANSGTRVERHVDFDLTSRQFLFYLAMLYPVRLPAANLALRLLKQRLEHPSA